MLYGAVAGYYGGRVDEVLMRFVDFLYGIPYMFLVILIMLLFSETARGEPLPVFLALGLVQWLTMARVVRGQVLTLRDREFVLATRAARRAATSASSCGTSCRTCSASSWSTRRSPCRP